VTVDSYIVTIAGWNSQHVFVRHTQYVIPSIKQACRIHNIYGPIPQVGDVCLLRVYTHFLQTSTMWYCNFEPIERVP
jgi:hypothetical protein